MLVIFTFFVNPCFSQKRNTKSKVTDISKTQSSIKVDKKHPSIYITFDKLGKWTPLREDESGEGVLLRLHNNMRYSIKVCGFGIPNKNGQFIPYSDDTVLGLKYDVVLNPVSITDERPNIDIPIGYNTGDTCQLFEVKSGKQMKFALPKEHLEKGLSIKIPFIYEWEDEGEPNHLVYFNSLSIPN